MVLEYGIGEFLLRLVVPFLASFAFLLGACSSIDLDSRPNLGPCPASAALYDASRVVRMGGEEALYSNITNTGEINGVRVFCRYVEDDPIVAQIEIDFAFGQGPAATDNVEDYYYFVSVLRSNGVRLSRNIFPIEVTFKNGNPVVEMTETVERIVIPRSDETISGANFEIIVGFELSDEELAFNRSGKRFLLGAGR